MEGGGDWKRERIAADSSSGDFHRRLPTNLVSEKKEEERAGRGKGKEREEEGRRV